MKDVVFLLVGFLAVQGAATQAAAQVVSAGSATIEAPGGVAVLGAASAPQSLGLGGVTFVLGTQLNGTLAVQLPGFVAPTLAGGEALLLVGGAGHVITGTTLSSQALSLSFSAGAELGGPSSNDQAATNVTLLLAQYN
jgi:hypothetical protein